MGDFKIKPNMYSLVDFIFMKTEYSAEIKSIFLSELRKTHSKHRTFDKFSTIREFKFMPSKSQNSFSF